MADKIAGIDVHKKVLMEVVMDARTPESKPERRRFATLPGELRRLSTWLQEQGVEEAVMESTAQYWRSVWLELEPHMCLHLAQAFSNRAPRGRKHDFKDAERLVRRLIAKELILSFVPDGEQRIWRNLTRMKLQLTRDRVRIQSQIECLLEEMRIKLSIVVSDLLGSSGLRILHALANGETDAKSLALLRLSAERITEAANKLGLSRSILYKLLQRYRRRPQTSSLLPLCGVRSHPLCPRFEYKYALNSAI
jgi:transposase